MVPSACRFSLKIHRHGITLVASDLGMMDHMDVSSVSIAIFHADALGHLIASSKVDGSVSVAATLAVGLHHWLGGLQSRPPR
jgi:hypothetical protein